MGKLIVNDWMSVDGRIQAPGLPDEDRSGGFQHGGWVGPLFDADLGQRVVERLASADALLYGRRTYEVFASYWPQVSEDAPDAPLAAILNETPTYVASTTLRTPLAWQYTTLLDGDVPAAVADLKDRYGEVLVTGSAHLAQTLETAGLADEYAIWTLPLLLGSSKRLFADGLFPSHLDLVDHHTTAAGVHLATYRRGSPLRPSADAW